MANDHDTSKPSPPRDPPQPRQTMFVQARVQADPTPGARRLLYIGDSLREFVTMRDLLETARDPMFVVDHAGDEVLAIQALTAVEYDAALVELGHDRSVWTRLVRDRRLPQVPLVGIDSVGRPEERTARRGALAQEGAD